MYSRISTFRLVFLALTLCTAWTRPIRAQTTVGGGNETDLFHVKITLKRENTDIQDILRDLFKAVKANYVIDEAIKGKLSVSFDQVPFRVALETVLKLAAEPLAYKFDNGIYTLELKEKSDRHPPGLGADFATDAGLNSIGDRDLVGTGSYFLKVYSNASATAIIQKMKELPELFLTDFSKLFANQLALAAFPADNSILIRIPSTSEGEMALSELQQRIKLLDVIPREVEVRVEVVLKRGGKASKGQNASVTMMGRTTSERSMKLQTTTNEASFTDSPIVISAGEYHMSIKPTANGDESVSLEVEADLDLAYRWPGETKTQRFRSTFTGAGRYVSGTPMLLSSTTLKSQTGKSSGDVELQVFITPILSKKIIPPSTHTTPEDK